MEDDEILTYCGTGKLRPRDALRTPKQRERKAPATSSACSTRESTPSSCSSLDYSTSSSDGVETRSRRRKRLEAEGLARAKLAFTVDSSSDDDDDFMFISSAKKSCLSPPSPRSPSPLPPPLTYQTPPAMDKKKQKLYDKANTILNKLKNSSFMNSEEPLVESTEDDIVLEDQTVTLRLRHRGKVHKYSVQESSPLLEVRGKLAEELGVTSKRIMLSYDTEILDVTNTPKHIGLSTVDIIDVILLTESEAESVESSMADGTSLEEASGSNDQITIKIENSNKHVFYSLRKSSKAMKAFAAELGVDVSKIAFSFGGEVIGSGQIAQGSSALEEIHFPPEWERQTETQTIETFPVPRGSDEWNRVEGQFKLTMPYAFMIRIIRIQNTWLWEKYMAHKRRLHKKNNGNVNELELFHGTGANDPKLIYAGEDGFDMRFCYSGAWGQANYFAANASYSDLLAHMSSIGFKEMFLVRVLTGDSYQCDSDPSLRMPPFKSPESTVVAGVQFSQMRYDTVTGATGGSQVYMTYDNDKAYPAYLLQYRTV